MAQQIRVNIFTFEKCDTKILKFYEAFYWNLCSAKIKKHRIFVCPTNEYCSKNIAMVLHLLSQMTQLIL